MSRSTYSLVWLRNLYSLTSLCRVAPTSPQASSAMWWKCVVHQVTGRCRGGGGEGCYLALGWKHEWGGISHIHVKMSGFFNTLVNFDLRLLWNMFGFQDQHIGPGCVLSCCSHFFGFLYPDMEFLRCILLLREMSSVYNGSSELSQVF